MVDTKRTLSALQTLFADNTSGAISEQDLRDFLVSVMPSARTATKVIAASDSSESDKINADYVCDGTADEAEWESAEGALGATGGKIVYCAGTYNHSGPAILNANKRIYVEMHGAKFVPANNQTAWRINQGTGGTALGCTLDGLYVNPGAVNGQTGIEFRDTDRAILKNFRIENCAVGVLFRSEAASTGWVEGAKMQDGYIGNCTTGWNATVGSGTGSFAETVCDNIHINDCTTAINWQQNSNFYRSTLSGVTVWLRDNQTGWTINGNVRGVRGDIAFESLDGTPTGINAITLSANASNTFSMNLDIDFEGSFSSRVVDASNKYIQFRWNGIHYMNHVDAGRLLRSRVLGDTNDRFGVIANAAAGGGWFIGNGGGDIFFMVGEAQDLVRVGGGFQLPEHADFSAPPDNYGIMYVKDAGANKDKFTAIFETGGARDFTGANEP